MQANLFKILAITAAFSMVQSAPVETAEGQPTQGQVNGTQINEAHINEADVDDVIPLLRSRRRSALGRKLLISAQERGRGIFSRGLVGIIPATQTLSVSDMDVLNAIFTLHRVAIHTRDAISVWPKDLSPWRRRSMDIGIAQSAGQTRIYETILPELYTTVRALFGCHLNFRVLHR
ncbi:hypothetical protein LI328DRAFT_160033 [Trichoderma asperelloides]|nr:hypothetical protein LI328DRAFT_160033 [Trichoderma asperelloides]